MATDNNIKNFTAADIERYHKGVLSSKEMHDLEKAAMDDPFLADALEGYAVAGVNAAGDISDLRKRLSQKTGGAKVIAMNTAPRNSFKILRAAVVVGFIAGAGLLIYQLGFNNKKEDIAKVEKRTGADSKPADTAKNSTVADPSAITSSPVDGIKKEDPKETVPSVTSETPGITKEEAKTTGGIETDPGSGNPVVTGKTAPGDVTIKPTSSSIQTGPPVKVLITDNKDFGVTSDKAIEKREDAEAKNKLKTKDADKEVARDEGILYDRATTASRKAENNRYYNNTNIFRGRVTDGDNNGVPFANVTNVQDNNAGTYTDARGYFNLTYPDTVLTVQVRSIGFENNNVQLRNSLPSNQVVLQDDRKSLSEVTLSKQKVNAHVPARNRDDNMKLETPEPADGWENYNTYVLNNLEIPDDVRNKQTASGEVLVSFEVDKNGEPTSIKIEKSLCSKCDKEAIRLVKEGPKWKRNAKKGRTTVTISF